MACFCVLFVRISMKFRFNWGYCVRFFWGCEPVRISIYNRSVFSSRISAFFTLVSQILGALKWEKKKKTFPTIFSTPALTPRHLFAVVVSEFTSSGASARSSKRSVSVYLLLWAYQSLCHLLCHVRWRLIRRARNTLCTVLFTGAV